MAIIDLRHLVTPECDTVKFIGAEDGQEYSLPVRKTIGMTLMLQQYMLEFNSGKSPEKFSASDGVEMSYYTLASWIRGFYPDVTVEWVKKNIVNEDLFIELMKKANDLFYPKRQEALKPKKKAGKSRK